MIKEINFGFSDEKSRQIKDFFADNKGYIKGAGLIALSLGTMAMGDPISRIHLDKAMAASTGIGDSINEAIRAIEENYYFIPVIGLIDGVIDTVIDKMHSKEEEQESLGSLVGDIVRRSITETGEMTLVLLSAEAAMNSNMPDVPRVVGGAFAALFAPYAILPDAVGSQITKGLVFGAQTLVSIGQRNQKR